MGTSRKLLDKQHKPEQ